MAEVGSGVEHFKGARLRKWGRWVAEVRLPRSRERIWLGSYATAEEAARAYDAAVFCLRGPGAAFNFPESPPDIASAGSLTKDQIREAAARYAQRWLPGGANAVHEGAGLEAAGSPPAADLSEKTGRSSVDDQYSDYAGCSSTSDHPEDVLDLLRQTPLELLYPTCDGMPVVPSAIEEEEEEDGDVDLAGWGNDWLWSFTPLNRGPHAHLPAADPSEKTGRSSVDDQYSDYAGCSSTSDHPEDVLDLLRRTPLDLQYPTCDGMPVVPSAIEEEEEEDGDADLAGGGNDRLWSFTP